MIIYVSTSNVDKMFLTGYIGSSSFLLQVKKVIQDLKQVNPNLIYGLNHTVLFVTVSALSGGLSTSSLL